MGRPRKVVQPGVAVTNPIVVPTVTVAMFRILRDGVFIADDVRVDAGDVTAIADAVAAILIERGHAKPV